jgi:HD superfamily phosphodiesterase
MSEKNDWRKWIPILEKELIDEMKLAPAISEVHAMDHILRVRERCIRLAEKLNADLEVLIAAIYLHDLGRHYILDKGHGALSAEKAEPVLERIDFPKGKREQVLLAIRVHDVTWAPEDRTSIESQILYDADKIDTLGAVGILRYILHYYGKKPIDFILEDIDMRWDGLALPETRDLALKDYEYIKDYFMQLDEELSIKGSDSVPTES